MKYSCRIKPHSCPLHDKGPLWELQLQKVNAQLASVAETHADFLKLQKNQRDLRTKVARYHRHLEQYSKCRDAVKAVETSLRVGDGRCVLYRDFVNCYNERGTKVKNLVLVKLTRGEDRDLVVEKIHNFCTDKESGCDAYYVADVFRHHMTTEEKGGSGLFDDIKEIFLAGDHGPHFASVQTVYNESTLWTKWGKLVHPMFLCSYHAYNRCDGAGVTVKREAESCARNNCGPITAENYAHLMNTGSTFDTYSFCFNTIDRGDDVFPKKLKKMKNMLEIYGVIII